MFLGIGPWDWTALIAYFVLITFLGLWTARKVSDTADFFMAGRRFGKAFMIFFAFGAGTSGNDAVGVSSKTYTNGLSGIWWQWLWLFCTPFYWLIAPVMRRMRCLTTGDYFEARYDGGVAALYTVVGVLQLTVSIGVIQLGAGSMIEAISGGAIHKNYAILVMTVLFVTYGMAGGLGAAIITDFIQGILTVILSFVLLPFALHVVGGFSGLHEQISDPGMFKIVAPGEINAFYIAMLCLSALIGIVTQPHIMGVCAAGRSEMDGRVGFAGGNLLKRFCTIAWMVVGLCGVVMYPGLTGKQPDLVYGQVAHDLLPLVMPGLIGVFLAALIASVMSSCDAAMVSCSGLFTQNLYRRWVARDKSERHYVLVGRIASLCFVICGVFFALMVEDVPKGLLLTFKLQALIAAAFWLGLFWRRATVAGAWAATVAGFIVLYATGTAAFQAYAAGEKYLVAEPGMTLEQVAGRTGVTPDKLRAWSAGPWDDGFWSKANDTAVLPEGTVVAVTAPALPKFMLWKGKFRDSWQIFFYLSAQFLAGILVSLVTRRVPTAKLDRVYNCLRTPVVDNEPHITTPFTLPVGRAPGNPPKVIKHPDFEIYMPSWLSVGGFLFFWAWVAGLIGFVYWMAGWGA